MHKLFFIFFLGLQAQAHVYPDYQFRALPQQSCSIYDPKLRKSLDQILKKFFLEAYYDRSIYYLKTPCNPLKAEQCKPQDLQFNSIDMYKEFGTGHCAGISFLFQNTLLKEDPSLPNFQLIPSTDRKATLRTQGPVPKYPHIALISQCQDGYVLLDPAMNIGEAIYLSKEKPSVSVDLKYRGIRTFTLANKTIDVTSDSTDPAKPWTSQQKEDEKYSYELQEGLNPEEALSAPYFLGDRKVLIFKFNLPEDPAYRITINLAHKRVESTKTFPDGQELKKALLFDEYLKNPSTLDAFITEENLKDLGQKTRREEIIKRIRTVIERVQG